jgi:hypothetical protein
MKTDISKKEIEAAGFFVAERMQHGENFDIALCIEDIHRMYGKEIADSIWEFAKIELNRETFDASPLGEFVQSL